MRVEVRLFATFASFLPPDHRLGRVSLDVPEGSRVADVVAILRIPDALPRMILVNGEDAPVERRLAGGDVLDMFPPLSGG